MNHDGFGDKGKKKNLVKCVAYPSSQHLFRENQIFARHRARYYKQHGDVREPQIGSIYVYLDPNTYLFDK